MAAEYGTGSGIDNITSLNCSIWSTLLSNNDSTVVTCNINVNSGALNLSNATIRMSGGYSINVKSGATMNVTSGSNITRDSGYYNFNYESGSRGNLSDSTIEYSYKLYINTNKNITIDNCTIRNNQHHGIHLTPISGYVNITDCTINNTVNQHGIFIESSQENLLRNNSLNNNTGNYSLYVTGNYDQDIDTTNTVNGGKVYYNYTDSGTITDSNIGHVTIVNCSNLWFTGCTIHNGDGVRIRGVSSNVSIRGSTIENNAMYGINLESTSWNNITSVTIENNTKQGVYLDDSSNNTINNSDILNNSNYGVHSEGSSSYNHVSYNNITNNTLGGMRLDGSGHNDITYNNMSENRGSGGICIGTYHYSSESTQNTLHNNTILSNNATGIGVYTNYNYLSNNTISSLSGQYALKVSYIRNSFYNYIWRNNTANGEQINYYYDEHDKITELADNIIENKCLSAHNVSNVGKITLIDCTNLAVRDNELSNNSLSSSYGIFLWSSDDNNLTNNTISNNRDGIRLYNSSDNDITDLDTISPSDQHGARIESNSDHNNITDSSLAATSSHGLWISSSEHTTLINTGISSVDQYGLSTSGAHYTNLTNATITSSSSDGVRLSTSHNVIITESNITANNTGVDCSGSNHTEIANTRVRGEDGIYMSESNWGNLTNNTINATMRGIFLTESRNHNLTENNITNYTVTGILLLGYSTNTTMIGNDLTWDGSEFDIRINDSNDCVIANNDSTAANYTFYLTNNTRLCTLDTVFNKTKVGYEDNESNLTLMWRIDVLCRDNYRKEPMWTNLTVRYSDLSHANGSLCWEGETANADGRLSNNAFGDYGPPTSSSNWLPIIEYKQNASGKTTYQPMNCTAINRWDVLQEKYGRSYRNVTTSVTEPGVTILVDAGYTPNGKCYYCHDDKLRYADGTFKFPKTTHWTKYNESITDASLDDPYTPGRCIDCHDENDSIAIPHGNASGKDLLYQPSPQLCYNGKGNQVCHNSSAVRATLNQKEEFGKTTHHPLGDGKLACKACHDNHGSKHRFDLLKYYTNATSSTYDSSNYALCFVCHLEEKIVAKMSGETDSHLQNYTNQTNFRDEYYGWSAGFASWNNPKNIHSPQTESGVGASPHATSNCYSCHNPHGSDNPATTRFTAKSGGTFNYTYITNVLPPDNISWEVLGHDDWKKSELNKGGGTYNSNCGCHDSFKLQTDYFTYRNYAPYEPAGGAGCLECHDNNASAYNETPIRPIVNLTAIKLAMHTNLSGAFREPNGGDLQGTDRNFNEWLEYRNYTPAQINNITEDNAICWACHSTNGTPPSPGFHPDRALNPYKCPKCHGPYDGQPPHTQGLVAAIDNHGPTTKGAESILIQTDVGSGGSCGDCHAPSKLPNSSIGDLKVWKYTPSKNFVDYNGRTTMGDVSHYGLNRSQGIDILGIDSPNILCDTTDCLFCHCNWTNGQIWGNATNISGNMYGADTENVSECYTYCHVRPGWVGNVTEGTLTHFHNVSIYAGGGPNCVLCHDVNSKYGVQSLVNATAIAEGIHGNILNNTLVQDGFDMDNRSNPCWGCHQSDGMIPEGMGDRNGITDLNDDGVITTEELPYTCEDCHARSDAWNSATSDGETWTSASDPNLGMNRLPPVISDHYPNSALTKTNANYGRCVDCHNNSIDQDHGDTAYKELGHTIFSGVSHYGTGETLLTPTKMCRHCHDNATNAGSYGQATQNKHGNFTNESNPDDGCYHCHANDQTPDDFHNMNAGSIPGDPDCLKCHGSNGDASRRRIDETVFKGAIHARMNNATTGPNGTNQSCWVCHFPEGVGMDEHSNRRESAYLCYDCHNKNGTPLFSNVSNAPNAFNHYKSGTNISAYWTQNTDSESCMGCHNQTEMFYSFDENDAYCTNFSITSHYGDNRTDLVSKYSVSNSTEYCAYCHINASSPFFEYPNNRDIRHAGNQGCNICHGDGRLHNETLIRVVTTGNCTDCHALYGVNTTQTIY
ncbi:MAG: NosD domain-containing protein, partial [Euryarchaeota archaeon]|nr:NosD domain-containing protein [Euryarchaeota archaeon]